jgi:hypothetical protein
MFGVARKREKHVPKSNAVIDPIDRIARILAIIAMKDVPDREEAARRLLAAGFDSPTIGGLLDVGPNFANLACTRFG